MCALSKTVASLLTAALLSSCEWLPFGPDPEQGKRQCWTTTATVEWVTPDSLVWEQADSVTLEDCRG